MKVHERIEKAAKSSGLKWLLVAAAWMVLWGFQAGRSGWCMDEAAHIPAGLYHWETGRMDSYRVNPPLPRMVAAIPLLLDRPTIDWDVVESPLVRSEFRFSHRWVRDNQPRLRTFLFRTRLTMLLFVAIGLWSIFCWTRDLYGKSAAAVASLMWVFNPDVITYASTVAPDVPAASSGLLVGYLFWRWLRAASRPFPWSIAMAVGFAILCKFSWLFLLPALPCIVLANDCVRHFKESTSKVSTDELAQISKLSIARDPLRLAVSFVLTVFLINWAYGFDGTGTRLGEFQFVSQLLGGSELPKGEAGNRFSGSPVAQIPVPLPAQMVLGIDFLKYEFETGLPCYLRGVWQHKGWWYFYLYAMAVKVPLGYWTLILAGVLSLFWDGVRGRRRATMEWIVVLLACLFVFLISSQTGFTHHVRYVLPAYGFLFMTASRVMIVLPSRVAKGLAVVCLSGVFVFHVSHIGLAHTFFNPTAGGPNEGWRHLGRSNVDWGQSIYRTVDWVKDHPEQRPITVLFCPSFGSPQQLVSGIDGVATRINWDDQGDPLTPAVPSSGWYLISSRQMTHETCQYFWDKTPLDQPYPDLLLFYIEKEVDTEGSI